MKRPQYVFRPNLNDPQHRRAWALLQQVPTAKRKEFLVQSILAAEQTNRLEKSIRKVVREELQTVNITNAVPSRMYRQLAALTENFPGDAASPGNDFLPQYQALYAQNSDLAGWIQIDGTNINYPVMQSKHDPDFYLKYNFEKADSPHGCPYVQANCDLQTPSDNIFVYGHNMKDGTMFSDLLQYKRESFWEQHRIIQFDTLTAQAEYTVMAVFRGEAEDLFAYYQCTDAETPQEFVAYVDACKNAALYDTGVTAAYGDKLLTLSTCDDSGKNSRVVVVAKRITEPR